MIELLGMSSPNVRKIVIALEEMGLVWQQRHVPVFRSGQFTPEIIALNPLSKVPIIIDHDGTSGLSPIFESGAILCYLGETYGPEFYPERGAQRWQVLQWVMVQPPQVGESVGELESQTGCSFTAMFGFWAAVFC